MSFMRDDIFSKHKDLLLKSFWQSKSYEGRYVIIGSKFLQKTHGIDVILQATNDKTEVKIDTKHVRGSYDNFYLEELSCPEHGTLGWILKEDGWPDYIAYCFWKTCSKCYSYCGKCTKELFPVDVYTIQFEPLRAWFLGNKDEFPLHENAYTINKTNGRLVPLKIIEQQVGYKKFVVNKPA